ncbi:MULTISPECIES: hypothetical protein [Croceitalea]|uniref:Lipoprotein n=1 Tax=Croceitalea vernalis TaxID=3075599 RepID=A0ABU3BGB4_9FLAO|nr:MULTISPECIES: hypothetical protein [unclassified Croceitalea]MDT0539422.1 hypothetical protein [Croceitalea sp. P059]MDT0621215.1 hypothetical protein [Croceitalea sp. P007]
MKKNLKKVQKLMLISLACLTLFSCDKNEEESDEIISNELVITQTELQFSDESEMISEEITAIAEDVYATDEIIYTSKGSYFSDYLPECVTITTVVTETSREKTIDFGEGCELPNGNILGGIISLSYARDMELAEKTITLNLEKFTFNSVSIEGGANILRVRSNENGNPQSTADASFSAVWPEGETATFEGERTREWIEGYGSGFWGDNVFLITGKRTFNNKVGNTFEKEVLSPLRRELSCRFIVSGVLSISRNNANVSLDFGDGECDAKGTLTYTDGSSDEVFLRRFLKN